MTEKLTAEAVEALNIMTTAFAGYTVNDAQKAALAIADAALIRAQAASLEARAGGDVVEAQAREMLAVGYDRQGDTTDARCMRRGTGPFNHAEKAALYAIEAALRTQPRPSDAVAEERERCAQVAVDYSQNLIATRFTGKLLKCAALEIAAAIRGQQEDLA